LSNDFFQSRMKFVYFILMQQVSWLF